MVIAINSVMSEEAKYLLEMTAKNFFILISAEFFSIRGKIMLGLSTKVIYIDQKNSLLRKNTSQRQI